METSDNGLPAGVVDAVLNRGELARALNKSEPTIDKMVADGMPVLTEGTNGRAYAFQLSDCWRWLKGREQAEATERTIAETAVQQMRLALIGGNDVRDQDRILSPQQRQAAYDAERSFMLTALKRGEQVKRDEVVAAFEEVFIIIRNVLTALPDRLEREAGVHGKALDLAIKVCDGALSEAQSGVQLVASGDAYRQAAE